jgi:hypothetical protein
MPPRSPGESRAIVMHRYGPPSVLGLERIQPAPLHPGEIRLRMPAAAG